MDYCVSADAVEIRKYRKLVDEGELSNVYSAEAIVCAYIKHFRKGSDDEHVNQLCSKS